MRRLIFWTSGTRSSSESQILLFTMICLSLNAQNRLYSVRIVNLFHMWSQGFLNSVRIVDKFHFRWLLYESSFFKWKLLHFFLLNMTRYWNSVEQVKCFVWSHKRFSFCHKIKAFEIDHCNCIRNRLVRQAMVPNESYPPPK